MHPQPRRTGLLFSHVTSRSSLLNANRTYIKIGQWAAPAGPTLPRFQAAQKACNHLLPGHPPTQAMLRAELRRLVRTAACTRAHRYPGYPDPSVRGGAIFQPGLPAGIDTSSPQFQAAPKACNEG